MDVRGKLTELLSKYFNIGDSYAYNLTRVKSAFSCGTVGLDDFEEFDDETVADIADYLIANGVTVQEWISVDDRLPEADLPKDTKKKMIRCLVYTDKGTIKPCVRQRWEVNGKLVPWQWNKDLFAKPTHWMYYPQPPKGE